MNTLLASGRRPSFMQIFYKICAFLKFLTIVAGAMFAKNRPF